MKKLMILMLVLVAVPAMAAVQLTASQVGDTNEVEIGYVADANVSGFALKVTATDGTILDVTNFHVGESAAEKGYGIFPGTIDINDAGEVVAYGSPVAPDTAPGAAGTGIGQSTVILEMGALYVDGNEPATSGTLCSVIVSDSTTQLCVDANTPLRGGVVYTDATQAEVTDACADVSMVTECFPSGHPDYDEWVAVGKPDSWCNERQCHGDADGNSQGFANYWVSTDDLAVLLEAWNKPLGDLTDNEGNFMLSSSGVELIAADFDHSSQGFGNYRVSTDDLGIMLENWQIADSPDPNCLDY